MYPSRKAAPPAVRKHTALSFLIREKANYTVIEQNKWTSSNPELTEPLGVDFPLGCSLAGYRASLPMA